MVLRLAKHELAGRSADCGAIEEQPDVARVGVPAAEAQAVSYHGGTGVTALVAGIDTLLHRATHLGMAF